MKTTQLLLLVAIATCLVVNDASNTTNTTNQRKKGRYGLRAGGEGFIAVPVRPGRDIHGDYNRRSVDSNGKRKTNGFPVLN